MATSGSCSSPRVGSRGGRDIGFTLIELLVVMAILAALLSIAAPRYIESVDRAKEAALQTNLRMIREAIDKHRADTGRYPDTLQKLVDLRYLRTLPIDPVTETSATWVVVQHPDGTTRGIFDIRSGAEGSGRDGVAYSKW
jgi:general secretion pathway protein G